MHIQRDQAFRSVVFIFSRYEKLHFLNWLKHSQNPKSTQLCSWHDVHIYVRTPFIPFHRTNIQNWSQWVYLILWSTTYLISFAWVIALILINYFLLVITSLSLPPSLLSSNWDMICGYVYIITIIRIENSASLYYAKSFFKILKTKDSFHLLSETSTLHEKIKAIKEWQSESKMSSLL